MPIFKRNEDVSLYYEIEGQGEPLLMIHGFMGTGATQFPALRTHMAKSYQVIAPDLRGYGQSTPKPRLYGVDFYREDAEDLGALLEHLDLSDVNVLGFSDGGEIALWLPILAPERFKAVVAWGAIGHFDDSIRPNILSNLSMNWRTPEKDALHGAEHIPEMAQRWVHSMLAMLDRGGDVTFSRAGEIQCPVLVMLGDRDSLNPVERGQAMADAIPKGEFMLFKDTGHPIHVERSRQFVQAVEKFLNQA
ncbi:MAG TPA: alpha/beta hydrolase, partial [Aggregatilineales bacterium]|nr:alpha/beta hydrolase [Aggregatilineales bacterium]